LRNWIRNLEAILETLVDVGRNSKDLHTLTEAVRQRLRNAICQALIGEVSALQVLTLDPSIEQTLLQSIRNADNASPMVVEPKFAEQLVTRIATRADRMMKANMLPVLLCSPDLRRHLRTLSERSLPHLRVLSMAEIPNSVNLKAFGAVGV
jgi:flagellar biosynthesis protein FlhA